MNDRNVAVVAVGGGDGKSMVAVKVEMLPLSLVLAVIGRKHG